MLLNILTIGRYSDILYIQILKRWYKNEQKIRTMSVLWRERICNTQNDRSGTGVFKMQKKCGAVMSFDNAECNADPIKAFD